jgi:predicted enzyme related to lactoylglutathione lyase
MAQSTPPGRFVWHELLTTDPKAAIEFYTRIFGWKTEPWENDPSYTLLLAAGGSVGGVITLEAKATDAPPHWLSYIESPDLKATVDAAVRLGAKVLSPIMHVPDVGPFAVLADPQGAVFASSTPESPMQVNDPSQPGEFSWHELVTTDHGSALRFYQELFGWEKTEAMDMGPPVGVYQMFGWGGKTRGGMYNKPKEMPAPPHWLPYAVVPDARKAASAVTEAGGQMMVPPMEVPGGDVVAIGLDPQGAEFAVHSIAAVAARS